MNSTRTTTRSLFRAWIALHRGGQETPIKAVVVMIPVLLMVLASSNFTSIGQAADPIPVVATFTDNLEDNVRSDARGAYLNGVDGVRCIIDVLDDFILQLNYPGNKAALRRQMLFDFTEPVDGSTARGSFFDDAFLNVDSIGALAVGQSRSSQAQFNTAIGLLRFNPEKYPGTSNVLVTRTSNTTWVITASVATGGDIAALVQQSKGNTYKQVGNYHMPFQIAVQLQ